MTQINIWQGALILCQSPETFGQLGESTVYWEDAEQKFIAFTLTGAESISLSEIGRELPWFTNLVTDLGERQEDATVITQDNTSSIHWTSDIGQFERNKQIDIRLRHIRDLRNSGLLTVSVIQ